MTTTERITGRLTSGLAAVLMPSLACAQGRVEYHGPHMWDGWGWMFMGPVMMVAFVAAVVVVVILIIRWLGDAGPGAPAAPPIDKSPLDILKERFARGEIDKDEFEERRRVLGD